MKIRYFLIAGAAIALFVHNAAAQDEPQLSASFDMPVLTSYVWRGQVLNDEGVLQPSLTLDKGGLSLNVWTNYDLTDSNETEREFSEVDLTASYTATLETVEVTGGIVEYMFPNSDVSSTSELFASVSIPDLVVVPALSLYYDFGEAQGFYGSAGLSYEQELQESLTFGTVGSLGYGTSNYNSFYFGESEGAFNDVNVSAYLAVGLTDKLALTPAIQYVYLVDSDVRDNADEIYGHEDMWIGSLKLTFSF